MRGLDYLVDPAVLRRSGRDPQHPGLPQPDVDSLALRERANARQDSLRGACDGDGALVAEALDQPREMAPVAVAKAAVAPAWPAAALVGLEEDDVEPGLAFLQRERGPETRVPAADDRDVGLDVTFERRRRLAAEARAKRFLEPPDVA
jgi:hypothetical protein